MAKSNYIQIRVSDEQKTNIQINASKNNQTITEYIMAAVESEISYDSLVNYIKDKITYYNSVNRLGLANVYQDLLIKIISYRDMNPKAGG